MPTLYGWRGTPPAGLSGDAAGDLIWRPSFDLSDLDLPDAEFVPVGDAPEFLKDGPQHDYERRRRLSQLASTVLLPALAARRPHPPAPPGVELVSHCQLGDVEAYTYGMPVLRTVPRDDEKLALLLSYAAGQPVLLDCNPISRPIRQDWPDRALTQATYLRKQALFQVSDLIVTGGGVLKADPKRAKARRTRLDPAPGGKPRGPTKREREKAEKEAKEKAEYARRDRVREMERLLDAAVAALTEDPCLPPHVKVQNPYCTWLATLYELHGAVRLRELVGRKGAWRTAEVTGLVAGLVKYAALAAAGDLKEDDIPAYARAALVDDERQPRREELDAFLARHARWAVRVEARTAAADKKDKK